MEKSDDLEIATQRVLLRVILDKGCQSLSQASLRTGVFDMEELYKARDSLVSRGLIRASERTLGYSPSLVVYEANV